MPTRATTRRVPACGAGGPLSPCERPGSAAAVAAEALPAPQASTTTRAQPRHFSGRSAEFTPAPSPPPLCALGARGHPRASRRVRGPPPQPLPRVGEEGGDGAAHTCGRAKRGPRPTTYGCFELKEKVLVVVVVVVVVVVMVVLFINLIQALRSCPST